MFSIALNGRLVQTGNPHKQKDKPWQSADPDDLREICGEDELLGNVPDADIERAVADAYRVLGLEPTHVPEAA